VSTAWWINHGDRYDEERPGGFISAPKDEREISILRALIGEGMRAGDATVHVAQGAIRAIGIVRESPRLQGRSSELPQVSGSDNVVWPVLSNRTWRSPSPSPRSLIAGWMPHPSTTVGHSGRETLVKRVHYTRPSRRPCRGRVSSDRATNEPIRTTAVSLGSREAFSGGSRQWTSMYRSR
jgi:hypothetical protein